MKNIALFLGAALFCSLVSCKKEAGGKKEEALLFKATGNIQQEVDKFRALLGNLNTTTGVTGGRREVNWDAVPDNLEGKDLPEDFFNPTGANAPVARQRGLAYSSAAGSFRASSTGFSDINNNAAPEFLAFSGAKTFANISMAKWDVKFRQPGAVKSASVQAFGMVFSDVDVDSCTSLEFFNGDRSIGRFFVPAHHSKGRFSFLGVKFNREKITRVAVSHDGFLAEGTKDVSQGGPRDLIVVDDFIYSEPVAE